jgi:trk system potassium uptake protein TrkA
LYRLLGGQIEALEFAAKKNERFYEKPLRELKIKENCLVAAIIRDGEVIIADGKTCIMKGDHVIVVTTHKNFDDLSDIFE